MKLHTFLGYYPERTCLVNNEEFSQDVIASLELVFIRSSALDEDNNHSPREAIARRENPAPYLQFFSDSLFHLKRCHVVAGLRWNDNTTVTLSTLISYEQ